MLRFLKLFRRHDFGGTRPALKIAESRGKTMVMAFFEWVSSHFSWEVLGAPIAHGLIARRPYQIGAALVVVLFLLLHKSVKKRLSEKSRLHVQPSERPVKLLG